MTGSKCVKKKKKRGETGRKTSTQVSQDCRALRLAGYCKKLSWCYTNLPIMILATSELACRVYDVYCSVQTMLFIYIAAAATFYCFRRCCHFFSPKDKYFYSFFFFSF